MYFQLVDNQVLSTKGQPDVFNLHRLTEVDVLYELLALRRHLAHLVVVAQAQQKNQGSS